MENSLPSSGKINIHPLAISSICDHFTRVKVGGSILPKDAEVIGLVFGTKTGGKTIIFDAVEVCYRLSPQNRLFVPVEQVENTRSLILGAYPQYELLGWYSVGDKATPLHLEIHASFQALMESAVFVLLSSNLDESADGNKFPLVFYKSETHLTSLVFIEIPFVLESSPIERITIDQITKQSSASLEVQNNGLLTSLKILEDELALVIDVLEGMNSAKLPPDFELMRRASKICHMIPSLNGVDVSQSYLLRDAQRRDLTDKLMATYLAAATKASIDFHGVIEVTNTIVNVSEKHPLARF